MGTAPYKQGGGWADIRGSNSVCFSNTHEMLKVVQIACLSTSYSVP